MREITTRFSVCLAVCFAVGALLAALFFLDAPSAFVEPEALDVPISLDEGAASGAPTLFRIGLVLPLFVLIRILFLFRVRHGAQ